MPKGSTLLGRSLQEEAIVLRHVMLPGPGLLGHLSQSEFPQLKTELV